MHNSITCIAYTWYKTEWFLSFCVIIIFVGIEVANLMPTGWTETERECTLGIVHLCDSDKFSIPPERHDLAINVTNLRCQGPSAFYREMRLKEGITVRTVSQVLVLSPVTGLSFALCWRPVFFFTTGTGCEVAIKRDWHSYKIGTRCCRASINIEHADISCVGFIAAKNYQSAVSLSVFTPTGARRTLDISGR
jgi:hypothetical protein